MTEKTTRKVELFDTSLRDGLQQPNLEISVPNAVLLLERMAGFGVDYAEIGFAGANQFVADLTGALDNVDTGAMKLALFGRTRGRGAKVEDWPDVQFMLRHKRRVPVAVVVAKSRLLDVEKSLETTPDENLLMTWETIDCLQGHGLEVIVDLEHAMDAMCGRSENGNPSNEDFRGRSLDHFHRHRRTVRASEGEPHRGVRHQRRIEPRRGRAGDRRPGARVSRRRLRIPRPHRSRAWASPTRARRSWPARCRCRAH